MDDRMRGIDEAVNSLFHFPRGPTGFPHLQRMWRNHQHRADMLVWRSLADGLRTAQLEDGDLLLLDIDGGPQTLSLKWLGADRMETHTDLGVGSWDELERQLHDLMLSGGPFGGPLLDTPLSGPQRYNWMDSQLPDAARVRYFGAGYCYRHRPLAGERYLAAVAPMGSFIACGGGQVDDVATLSEEFAEKIDPFVPEIGDSSFYVRLHGDPVRLRYAAVPGLLGYRLLTHGAGEMELFLCLLGRDDLALISVERGTPRLLARGASFRIVGTEVSSRESVSAVPPVAPRTLKTELVAAAIRGLSSFAPTVREHFARLATAAHGATGMRSVRLLLWQIALAHELGLRDQLSGPIQLIFQAIAATTGIKIEALPHDRARRPALKWLNERSPLFYPLGMNRDRWAIRSDWLGAPPFRCVDLMKRPDSAVR